MAADLPVELLSQIFSYFQPEADTDDYDGLIGPSDPVLRSTLANLLLVNRRFFHVARPHLYHTIEVPTLVTLRGLLRSIIERPEIGSFIEHVHTGSWLTKEDLSRPIMTHMPKTHPPPQGTYRSQLFATIAALELPSDLRQEFIDGIEFGIEDPEYALFFLLCGNIRMWEMESVRDFHESLVIKTIRGSRPGGVNGLLAETSKPLQRLRRFVQLRRKPLHGPNIGDFFPILGLPLLESFKGRENGDHRHPAEGMPLSNLEEIILTNSNLHPVTFVKVLKACPKLKGLQLKGRLPPYENNTYGYHHVSEPLRHHGTHITSFHYTLSQHFWGGPGAPTEHLYVLRPFGSLKWMKSLQELVVPHVALFGGARVAAMQAVDWLQMILPTSLRLLKISDAQDADAERLNAQLSCMMNDASFAQLSTIGVECTRPLFRAVESAGWEESRTGNGWLEWRNSARACDV